MASVLYQSIETLSRDKGIEPGIVVGAVEDAIALATRKYYKTQMKARDGPRIPKSAPMSTKPSSRLPIRSRTTSIK